MELGTAIVGIIVALICIVPFVILNINKKKREKHIFNILSNLAEENKTKTGQFEIWGNSSIGLDLNSQYILFSRQIKDIHITEVLKLSDIERSKVLKTTRSVSINEGSPQTVIDKVEIVFDFIDNKKSNIVLEFYNSKTDRLTLAGELLLAEKWSNLINQCIPSNMKQSL